MPTVQRLAERLLTARSKALRARISALTEPGRKNFDERQASHLRARELELKKQGIREILKEFGLHAEAAT
jgi:hypothetical protein